MCACVSVRVRVCMCACAYVYSLARYIEGLQPRKRKRQEGKDRDVKQQKIPFMTIFFLWKLFWQLLLSVLGIENLASNNRKGRKTMSSKKGAKLDKCVSEN